MGLFSWLVDMVFGPEVYCDHGMKGSEGVCGECCNDLYGAPEDEGAEVVDFSTYRDTV